VNADPAGPGGPGAHAHPPPATGPVAARGIFDAGLLSACISCGFCLPACPTYSLTRDERSSPRGRITLMRALEEGRLDVDDPTLVEQASFCLGCRACETVCPAGVQYGALFEQWRDHQWRGRHAPVRARAVRAAMRVRPALAAAGRLRGAARPTGSADPGKVHLMLGCAERALFPYPVFFPTLGLSTDNAAMIGAAAFPKLHRREFAGLDLRAKANLALA